MRLAVEFLSNHLNSSSRTDTFNSDQSLKVTSSGSDRNVYLTQIMLFDPNNAFFKFTFDISVGNFNE